MEALLGRKGRHWSLRLTTGILSVRWIDEGRYWACLEKGCPGAFCCLRNGTTFFLFGGWWHRVYYALVFSGSAWLTRLVVRRYEMLPETDDCLSKWFGIMWSGQCWLYVRCEIKVTYPRVYFETKDHRHCKVSREWGWRLLAVKLRVSRYIDPASFTTRLDWHMHPHSPARRLTYGYKSPIEVRRVSPSKQATYRPASTESQLSRRSGCQLLDNLSVLT